MSEASNIVTDLSLHDFVLKSWTQSDRTLKIGVELAGRVRELELNGVIHVQMSMFDQPQIISRIDFFKHRAGRSAGKVDCERHYLEALAERFSADVVSIEFHSDWSAIIVCESYHILDAQP